MFCNIFVTISTESSPFSKPSANPRCFFCGDLERRHFTIIYTSRCYRILIALLPPFIRGLATQITRQKADNQTDRQYLPFQVSAKTGFTPKTGSRKIFTFPHLDIRISRLLEDNATPADRAAHIDLADWLIKYLQDSNA